METTELLFELPLLEDVLAQWKEPIGADFAAYRNHCYRVSNFCLNFCHGDSEDIAKVSIAAGFHDLGIWTAHTLDYLAPSVALAERYLVDRKLAGWAAEIAAMIQQHHKVTPYRGQTASLVEAFRRADWIDVTRGLRRFGLSADVLAAVLRAFPNAGFHRRLTALTWQRLKSHPLDPLPMLRL